MFAFRITIFRVGQANFLKFYDLFTRLMQRYKLSVIFLEVVLSKLKNRSAYKQGRGNNV